MNYDELKAIIENAGVHPQLGPTGAEYGIEQNPHELATFLTSIPPDIHTVLEIGTGYRAALANFMASVLGWQVTTVDRQIPSALILPGVTFILADSAEVLEHVGSAYDLVIVDASHDYDSATRDYETFGPLGRVVMLHDIAGLRDCEGVARLWRELSRTKSNALKKGYYEVIDSGPMRAGIGWIVK
jgi:hypothetical protein